MAKEPKNCFVVTYPLKTELWQEHILEKRFEVGRKIQNALTSIVLTRLKEMRRTKVYRELISSLSSDKEKNELIWKEIEKVRESYGLNEYAVSHLTTPMKQHFKGVLDIHTVQKISKRVWTSFDKVLHGDGKKIHLKKYGTMHSLESKSNNAGIRYRNGYIEWLKIKMPIIIDENNSYEVEAFDHTIKYNRIIREFVGHKYRYYIQIVFDGFPPVKRKLGLGDVGLDIGTSTLAVASDSKVMIIELADKVQGCERGVKLLQRKLDRSRRAMNPNKYNKDGSVKKGAKNWILSKHYMRTLFKYKELSRKQAAIRKWQHEILANKVISLGDKFYVEDMDFNILAKKAKKPKDGSVAKNEKGKCKRRKRFGKSMAKRAPATFLQILARKLRYFNVELTKINIWEARASQFNHFDKTYVKKTLSQRWNYFETANGGLKVQRDMYSAFLIMNVNPDLSSFNIDKCNSRFENFYKLHQKEVERLTGRRNLSSIAI